jgi:hypothetical protein
MAKKVIDHEADYQQLFVGQFIKVRRKPTNDNWATVVKRQIRSIDRELRKIKCDDNIDYKFKNIIFN